MTRRERIQVLLEYLVDVREGLGDRHKASSGEWGNLLSLMGAAWNEPAYQELERLLPFLRDDSPRLYWHVCERYLRYGEIRVAFCRRCGNHHASKIGEIHRHPPGKSVTLQPRVVRSIHRAVDPVSVDLAVGWLDGHWRGEAALPKGVLELESERRLRVA